MINEDRLVRTFLELVAIDSPSGQEEAVGLDLVRRLSGLGGEVERDEHGNVFARWPNRGRDWVLLSAHMDTVGKDLGIRPQIRDGVIYSDGTTILGSDDKSGIAVILETIQSLSEDGIDYPKLEVVFSVGEEVQLRGARLMDKSRLRARHGFVLDGGGPIGTIVVAAPSQDSLQVTVIGKAAHAGSEPENGINAIRVAAEAIAAMPLGRIDFETTANIGVIEGGVATNIVPERVLIRGEARSRDDEKLAKQTAAMAAAFQDAADRHHARVEFKITHPYSRFRWTEETPAVRAAMAAARRLGFEPILVESGGGLDANVFSASGIACVALSSGMSAVHTPQEHVAIADMVDSARLMAEIVASGW